ncbi:MAG: alpha/beta hydrolase family protein [Actinomycetota bacterium]
MPSPLLFTTRLTLTLGLISVTLPSGAARQAARPAPGGNGPHPVVIAGITLTDAARKRDLPLKVYAPQTRGRYPVIVFSHGVGSSRDAFGPLARFWASHGFVAIHPSHADSTTVSPAGLERALASPATWQDRTRDVSFILDSLNEIERRAPELRGALDGKRVAVAGHSLGALTAMLVGGATVDVPGGVADRSFANPRASAVLAISPPGTGQQGLTVRSWRKMTLPMMTVTGSRDFGAGRQTPEWRKHAFRYSPTGDKQHVLIQNAGHYSFGGELASGSLASSALGPRANAQLRAGRRFAAGARGGDRPEIFQAVKAATLAFWNVHLKQDAKSKAQLTSRAFNRDFAGKASLEQR